MSEVSVDRGAAPAPIASWRELQPYVLLAGSLLFVLIYFIGAEEGALSIFSGMKVHEFVHDARHLLGFPCH
jgi:Probable cobalt transporter subunit (CbtB)